MDIFRAIYQRYQAYREADDAYTLTSGRMWQTQAPDQPGEPSPDRFPYVVVTTLGGDRKWMFSGDVLRSGKFQFAVYDDAKGNATRAWNIWRSLEKRFKRCMLFYADDSTAVDCIQETEPRADIDGGIVSISGDWRIERQT